MFDKLKNEGGSAGDLGKIGDIKQYGEDLNFPATRDDIVSQLKSKGADERVLSTVKDVGQDHFSDQNDFLSAFMKGK